MRAIHASSFLKAILITELVVIIAHKKFMEVKHFLKMADCNHIRVVSGAINETHGFIVRNSHCIEGV